MSFSGELLIHFIFIQSGEFYSSTGKFPFSKTVALIEEFLLSLLVSFCCPNCTGNK